MRDAIKSYIHRQHISPTWIYIMIVSLYLNYLNKKKKEQTMFGSKTKQQLDKNIYVTNLTQAKMGTACAMAIVGNILLHAGFVITGFTFIGFGLFMVLYYVCKTMSKIPDTYRT